MTIKYYYMFSISSGSKGGDFANTELKNLFSLCKNTHSLAGTELVLRGSVYGYKKKENSNYKRVFKKQAYCARKKKSSASHRLLV